MSCLRGRPKGARNRLGTQFLEALEADFNKFGPQAIALVREKKPEVYIRVVADLLPKEANINVEAGEAFVQLWRKISDGLGEELADRLDDTARFISGLPSSVPFASRRSIFHAHCRDSSPPNRASSFSITCASYALMLGIMVLSCCL